MDSVIVTGSGTGLGKETSLYLAGRGSTVCAALLRDCTPTQPEHVARAIHRALTARRPRLRYMAGRRAKLVYLLRRYLPDRLFETLYFGGVVRYVTRSS